MWKEYILCSLSELVIPALSLRCVASPALRCVRGVRSPAHAVGDVLSQGSLWTTLHTLSLTGEVQTTHIEE